MEDFGILSCGHSHGHVHRCGLRPACSLRIGTAAERTHQRGCVDHDAYWTLPNLVCAKHPGPRRHLCRGSHFVGLQLRAAAKANHSAIVGWSSVFFHRRARKRNRHSCAGSIGPLPGLAGCKVREVGETTNPSPGRNSSTANRSPRTMVRLPSRTNGIHLWQPRIFALQRNVDANAVARARRLRPPAHAPHRAHESLRAGALHAGRHVAQSYSR